MMTLLDVVECLHIRIIELDRLDVALDARRCNALRKHDNPSSDCE